MKINRRTAHGWAKQENTDKHYCDECKRALWLDPAGKPYCNTQMCGTDYEHFKQSKP